MCFSQAFELATGDYLFEPHSGEDYSRDEGKYLLLLFKKKKKITSFSEAFRNLQKLLTNSLAVDTLPCLKHNPHTRYKSGFIMRTDPVLSLLLVHHLSVLAVMNSFESLSIPLH